MIGEVRRRSCLVGARLVPRMRGTSLEARLGSVSWIGWQDSPTALSQAATSGLNSSARAECSDQMLLFHRRQE